MIIERSIEIEATPERVWQTIYDVERWPQWTASVESLNLLDGPKLEVGGRARIKQPGFPTMVWRATQVIPGVSFTWEATSPGTRSVGFHSVAPTANGCLATLRVEQTGLLSPLLALFASRSRRYVEMEANGLKQHCEATPVAA